MYNINPYYHTSNGIKNLDNYILSDETKNWTCIQYVFDLQNNQKYPMQDLFSEKGFIDATIKGTISAFINENGFLCINQRTDTGVERLFTGTLNLITNYNCNIFNLILLKNRSLNRISVYLNSEKLVDIAPIVSINNVLSNLITNTDSTSYKQQNINTYCIRIFDKPNIIETTILSINSFDNSFDYLDEKTKLDLNLIHEYRWDNIYEDCWVDSGKSKFDIILTTKPNIIFNKPNYLDTIINPVDKNISLKYHKEGKQIILDNKLYIVVNENNTKKLLTITR